MNHVHSVRLAIFVCVLIGLLASSVDGRTTVTKTKMNTSVASPPAQNFLVAPVYGVHFTPHSIAVGDFNNDGILDVAVANENSSDISILLGNGDGTFQTQTQIKIGTSSQPMAVVAVDLNADGKLDLAVADGSFTGNIYVLLGNGDGTFQTPVAYPVGREPSSIAAGDVNGDGAPDLAVTNFADNTVSVLLNDGSGGFGTPAVYGINPNDASFSPNSVLIADINGDGKPDLVTANQASNDISLLLNQGSGTFGPAANYCVVIPPPNVPCSSTQPVHPWAVAVGDLNGDGFPDIAVANDSHSVTLFLSSGSAGTFTGPINLSIGMNPHGIEIADVNGDSKQDLILGDYGASSFRILLGNGDGTFGTTLEYESGTQPAFVATGDFNGDHKLDLIIANSGERDIAVALGNGDGTFEAARGYDVHTAKGFAPNSMVQGDFNGDGKLDLLVLDGSSFSIPWTAALLLGNGDGTFQAASSVAASQNGPFFIAAGDFNQDKKLDFVVANQNQGSVTVSLGNGDGTFATGTDYSTGGNTGPSSVSVADVNGDGYPDIITSDVNFSSVIVLINNRDGTFAGPASYPVGTSNATTMFVAVADLNGDGHPDIVAVNETSRTVSVFLNNGDGTFGTAASFAVGINPLAAAIADFNHDGHPDLVVANGGGDNVSVLLGNGDGTFGTAVSYPVPANSAPRFVSAADVTNDGIPDIIVADTSTNQVSVLAGNGDGTFQSAVSYNVGGNPESIAIGDFNGDGKLDLATANSLTTDVTILVNTLPNAVASTTTSVASSANPSAFGQSVTFTATVTASAGTPTGTVNFNDGPNLLGSGSVDNTGHAVFSTSSLTTGTHSITAAYTGTTGFAASTSSPISQVVNQASSSTTVSSSGASTFGQSVTFTAVVSSSGGTPTGSVSFLDGATVIGSGNLSAGVATFSTSSLTAGTHSITASYGGDINFTGSTSSPISQVVSKATTTTTLASNPNPSFVTQMVTFTATVSGNFGGTVTGSVTFKQGTTTLGTSSVNNGQASIGFTYTKTGTFTVTATYSGDANNTGSSASLSQSVKKIPTKTIVSSSQNPSNVSQSVTFTATITATIGTVPDGEFVTFKDGTTALGTGTTTAGVASLTTSSLSAGTHNIKASYAGDVNYQASTSTNLSQVVLGNPTTTSLQSSSNPSIYGQSITFTAIVTPNSGTGVPTGTVTFKSGTSTIGTATLSNGTASVSNGALTVGTKSITAIYSGDTTFAGSTSAVLSQVINKANSTTNVTSSPNPSSSGQAVTITATVSPQFSGTPSGSVNFKVGSTNLGSATLSSGVASINVTSLPTGTDTITATYTGSTNFNKSSGTTTQIVQ